MHDKARRHANNACRHAYAKCARGARRRDYQLLRAATRARKPFLPMCTALPGMLLVQLVHVGARPQQIIAGGSLDISLYPNARCAKMELPRLLSRDVQTSKHSLRNGGLHSLLMTEACPLVLYPVRRALSRFYLVAVVPHTARAGLRRLFTSHECTE